MDTLLKVPKPGSPVRPSLGYIWHTLESKCNQTYLGVIRRQEFITAMFLGNSQGIHTIQRPVIGEDRIVSGDRTLLTKISVSGSW